MLQTQRQCGDLQPEKGVVVCLLVARRCFANASDQATLQRWRIFLCEVRAQARRSHVLSVPLHAS